MRFRIFYTINIILAAHFNIYDRHNKNLKLKILINKKSLKYFVDAVAKKSLTGQFRSPLSVFKAWNLNVLFISLTVNYNRRFVIYL